VSPSIPDISTLGTIALAQWESEGGADAGQAREAADGHPPGRTPLTDAELVQLRIRVIALENLIVALLVRAPECQRSVAREMAAYIRPRPGFTPHPVTMRAAGEMLSLVDRADRFWSLSSP
jgi:hypothetical protein